MTGPAVSSADGGSLVAPTISDRLSGGATKGRGFVWARVVVIGLVAISIWALALTQVPYRQVTDLGLVSVLPIWGYTAFALVAGSFAWMLTQPRFPGWLAVVLTLILIGFLNGTSPYLSGEPRLAVSWRHLGVIDYVLRHGGVDPTLDIYHDWPGFFILVASLVAGLGLSDLRAYATWAPVWWSLVYLPVLHLLFSTLGHDRRLTWLAIWLFFTANWIGQDYFAPQALGFLIYLSLATLLIRWLARRDRPDHLYLRDLGRTRVPDVLRLLTGRPGRAERLRAAQRTGLVAVLVAAFAFTVTAHQLTPFFILGMTVALMMLWRVRWLTLPVLMVVLISGWIVFPAVPYLIGHLHSVVEGVASVGAGVTANILGRLEGSPDHQLIVRARVAFTVLFWGLAALGVVRRLRAGRWDVTAIALAVAPFPVFALQTYGGEMLLRVTLFSLPFMAYFAAMAVRPPMPPVGRSWQVFTAALVLVMATSFMVVRYGNERLETFTPQEVNAVDELYAIAPPGSQLLAITANVPWKSMGYEQYRLRPIGSDFFLGDEQALLAAAEAYPGSSYLIVSRSQRAYAELVVGLAPGEYDALAAGILASGRFETLYRNEDAILARYIPQAGDTLDAQVGG